jgi:hypothetical protein
MKNNYLRLGIFCFLGTIIMIFSSASAANTNETSIANFIKDPDFWQQATVAAVGALLAFLFAFILSQISERRKPRKQLSYDLDIKKGIIKIEM